MASLFSNNSDILLKLTATSLGLTTALAKLYAYKSEILQEVKKDREYLDYLQQGYLDAAESDLLFAEKFAQLSAEADKIALE